MKNYLILFVVFILLLTIASCEKCYKCQNVCKVCYERHQLDTQDTVLTITVCSNTLSEKYYNEYIDSLTSPSLGWVCNDTASTFNERFCGTKSGNNVALLNKKDGGMICNAEE